MAILGPQDAEVGLTLLNLAAVVAGQGRKAEAASAGRPRRDDPGGPPSAGHPHLLAAAEAVRALRAAGMTRGPAPAAPRRPALIPALPRPAWVVLGGDFISAVGSGLTLPCLFIYAHQVRHLGYGTAGLVVATDRPGLAGRQPAGRRAGRPAGRRGGR